MEDITKYLNNYISQEKKTDKPTKKRSRNDKNTEVIQISDVEDNEINKKDNLKWNPSWPFKYPWLYCEKRNGKEVMFCKICKNANSSSVWTTTGLEWLKEDCIKRHQQSKKHIKAINAKNSNQLTIKEGFMQQMNHNQALIICCMRNIYYLTQRNIALNNYGSFCDLITYQINYQYQTGDEIFIQNLRPPLLQNHSEITTSSSSTNNYALYKNAVAERELLFSIFTIVEESVVAEVKESSYASADGIMNVINLFITQKELDITKLRHFGSDGAATITGIRNGVATQLKKLNNFITSTHCVAHRLHLASEEAANETPYFAHYKTIIKGIYSYFSNSYKRMYELKKIKEDMEVSDLTILNILLNIMLKKLLQICEKDFLMKIYIILYEFLILMKCRLIKMHKNALQNYVKKNFQILYIFMERKKELIMMSIH
ncbi:zinc finger protein 862-like [Rhizophagus irregularis DAOM 181602=DAOM 197198]|nr:zinc finger protein 862-like [Rhizophagus irregularis DAOM 181602=DAOM 197198]